MKSNSIKQFITRCLVIFLLMSPNFFLGCAPGLGSSISLNAVSKVDFEAEKVFTPEDNVKINILNFSDNRTIEAVAEIDGRLIRPDGDVGLAAQKIFESAAKKAGVKVSMFDAPVVRGAIKEWHVAVKPGFPSSSLEAKATVNIDLLDRDGGVVMASIYSGSFTQQNPFMGESSVQSGLAKAMAYALSEVFKDGAFISKLNVTANAGSEINY